jgi:hypothetical protein
VSLLFTSALSLPRGEPERLDSAGPNGFSPHPKHVETAPFLRGLDIVCKRE